jgi:hypothetical protein
MFADESDVFALTLAAIVAAIVLRGWLRRALGAIALGGLWFVSEGLFVAMMGLAAVSGLIWLARRFLSGKRLVTAVVFAVLGGAFFVLIGMTAVGFRSRQFAAQTQEYAGTRVPSGYRAAKEADEPAAKSEDKAVDRTGNFLAQTATGGVLEGVTPVALSLPAFERSVYASRELVTRERPFHPVLFYATAWALLPLAVAWLAALVALIRLHSDVIGGAWSRLRARLARGPVAPESATEPTAPPTAGT